MATKHKLSGGSNTMQCCINCVAMGDAKEVSWGQYVNNEEGITKPMELSTEQISWMETRQNDATSVVQYCMEMEEYTVFGIRARTR